MVKPTRLSDSADQTGERRQLTVMFCDLVGSTALSERFDPEDLRDMLRSYRQACASAIQSFGGFVAQYVGDGIVAYFGYPQAHEFESEHAVRAALKVVQNLAGLSDPQLKVRIGIATGTVVVGDIVGEGIKEQHAVVGQTPNLASRLMSLAGPNEVIVADATQQLLSDLFEFRDLGATRLKGFSEPVHSWKINGESKTKSRSHAIHKRVQLTPFIAREDEIRRLTCLWDKACAGKGQAVLISGEAGIGKSRLTRQFQDQFLTKNDVGPIKRLYCSESYRNSTLRPVIDRVVSDLQIKDIEGDHNKEAAIKDYLIYHSVTSDDAVNLMFDLLEIDSREEHRNLTLNPEARKALTLHILERYLCKYTYNRPILVVVEDLHWSDPTTLELLDRVVVNRVHSLPMLILLTAREEFEPSWSNKRHITKLDLVRLSPMESEKLLNELALEIQLPDPIKKEIIDRSDRIPFFLEEVFKATSEGFLRNKSRKNADAQSLQTELEVPTSLVGSLTARLDRLGPAKAVAQVAAAVGIRFSFEVLNDISRLGVAKLRQALDQLLALEIVCPLHEAAETTFVFKHALLRDAAYSSLLRGERRKLHQQIAEIFLEKYPEIAKNMPELLAHHYSSAGLAEQAIDCWLKAGERARERSANSEAIGHLSSGLNTLKALQPNEACIKREIDLRTSLALALAALHGGGAIEVGENYDRARQLGRHSNDLTKQFTIMIGSWLNSFIGSDLNKAKLLSRELLELAGRTGETAHLVEAKRARGMTLFYIGNFSESRSTIESALALHDPEHHKQHALRYGLDPLVCCEAYLAYVYLFLGYSSEALGRSDKSVLVAQAIQHPYTYAFSLAFASFVRQNLGMRDEAKRLAIKAIQFARKNEFQFWRKQQSVVRYWADAHRGNMRGRTSKMRAAVDSFLEAGPMIGSTRILSMMAEVYIKYGFAEEGSGVLQRAHDTVAKTGEMYYLAEIYRLEAELCLVHRGTEGIAGSCTYLQQALDISESQKAILWQIKIAQTVASLGQEFSEQKRITDHLVRLCREFKEGDSSADLISASRRLLQDLSQAHPIPREI